MKLSKSKHNPKFVWVQQTQSFLVISDIETNNIFHSDKALFSILDNILLKLNYKRHRYDTLDQFVS